MTSEFEELEEVAKNYERAYKLIHGKVAKVLLKPALVVETHYLLVAGCDRLLR